MPGGEGQAMQEMLEDIYGARRHTRVQEARTLSLEVAMSSIPNSYITESKYFVGTGG